LDQIACIDPKDIVYADEAGMDNRDDYAYGWNQKGERFHSLKSGRREGRINMIAAYCNHQLISPFTIAGSCNRAVFETWVKTCLICALKPGQWLVIDNATFHKGGRIEQLIEQAACKVLYLPPYSPDLNKIEKCWSWIKSRIRHCLGEFDSLHDAMDHVLKMVS
jgi:transposase